jgi:hypothetical protein
MADLTTVQAIGDLVGGGGKGDTGSGGGGGGRKSSVDPMTSPEYFMLVDPTRAADEIRRMVAGEESYGKTENVVQLTGRLGRMPDEVLQPYPYIMCFP